MSKPPRARMGPPVVKRDVQEVNQALWPKSALNAHIGDLERLLMLDVQAPVDYDGIVFRDKTQRSKVLVTTVTKSLQANPGLRPMVQRIGPALMADRTERLNLTGKVGPQMEEAIECIKRTVAAPPAPYRHRG